MDADRVDPRSRHPPRRRKARQERGGHSRRRAGPRSVHDHRGVRRQGTRRDRRGRGLRERQCHRQRARPAGDRASLPETPLGDLIADASMLRVVRCGRGLHEPRGHPLRSRRAPPGPPGLRRHVRGCLCGAAVPEQACHHDALRHPAARAARRAVRGARGGARILQVGPATSRTLPVRTIALRDAASCAMCGSMAGPSRRARRTG